MISMTSKFVNDLKNGKHVKKEATLNLNGNTIVIGGTGSGKSGTYLVKTLDNPEDKNLVCVVTKKESMMISEEMLKQQGYSIEKLVIGDPIPDAIGYDPLIVCENDDDIRDLAKSMVPRTGHERENYWQNAAEGIIYVVLKYVRHGHYAGGTGMASALEILKTVSWHYESNPFESDEDKRRRLKRENAMNNVYIADRELENLKDIDIVDYFTWKDFQLLPAPTGGCIAHEIRTSVDMIFSGTVINSLNKQSMFTFDTLLNEKTALLIKVSPVSTAQHNFITIFYSQLLAKLFTMAEKRDNGRLPYPVHVFADDFATGCPIPNFADYISIFRAKGISATMLIQSETQLASLYGDENASTIINNCEQQIYMGGMDVRTCESISRKSNFPFEEVINLKLEHEIVLHQGDKPIMRKRRNMMTCEAYKYALEKCNLSMGQ